MSKTTHNSRINETLFGLAFGDSWGYTTEFLQHSQIDPNTSPSKLAVVSDDTQMSLYNLCALYTIFEETRFSQEWQSRLLNDKEEQDRVRVIFANEHLKFAHDPDNNRAPGTTCMSALRQYGETKHYSGISTGLEGIAPTNNSKGCGTIMRAPWFGLISRLSREAITVLSVLQSQTTHGHPDSWVSAATASLLIRDIIEGRPDTYSDVSRSEGNVRAELMYNALDILKEMKTLNSTLNDSVFSNSVENVMSNLRSLLLNMWGSFSKSPISSDATDFFGEGWVADEALFVSVAVASLYRGSPVEGVKRLVWTSGDSDSIAAVGGAFLFADPACNPEESESMLQYMRNSLEERYLTELLNAEQLISLFNGS